MNGRPKILTRASFPQGTVELGADCNTQEAEEIRTFCGSNGAPSTGSAGGDDGSGHLIPGINVPDEHLFAAEALELSTLNTTLVWLRDVEKVKVSQKGNWRT